MALNIKDETVIKVKINMENDEIELVEENKVLYDNCNDETEHYIINEIGNSDVVKLVIMEDDEEIAEVAEEEADEETEKINEVIEHVCGKCFQSYSNLNRLKRHLKFCRTQTKIDNTQEQSEFRKDMEKDINIIEEEAKELETKDVCFCCLENFETCHSGHIRCYECPKSFKNSKSFERHVFLIHAGNENYPCKTCNARCPSMGILELHEKSHTRGKPFACKKCGKEFTRRYHLYRHQQFSICDNQAPKKEIVCKVCSRVFYRIDNLRSHLRQHLADEPKNRDYKCPYCEKSFYGTATLNIHIRSHTGERPFPCDLCEKSFPSNAALRKHRRSHTGEKPYPCKRCSKSFAAKEVLNRHMKTHTGERPHSCLSCGKSFIQATQLRNHNLLHHSTEPIQCKLCDEDFSSNQRLKKHVKVTHSTAPELQKCDYCNESFKTIGGVRRHISRTHKTAEHKCLICNEKFSSKKEIDLHLVQHKKERIKKINKLDLSSDSKSNLPLAEYTVKNIEYENIKTEDLDSNVKIEEYTFEENTETMDENSKMSDSEESDHTLMEIDDPEDPVLVMNETNLKSNIQKLLDLLLDKEILVKFGWPSASVENVLQEVIKNCGHTTKSLDNIADYATKMREYVKLLFTVVIDNDSIKQLLNNHSIDEVIDQVLKMAKVK